MSKTRKEITFDINGESLKRYYPKPAYNNAYRDIGRYMAKNGFEHIEGSVYISKQPLNEFNTIKIMKQMLREMPWLNKCISDWTMTNVGRSFNLNNMLDRDIELKENKLTSSAKSYESVEEEKDDDYEMEM